MVSLEQPGTPCIPSFLSSFHIPDLLSLLLLLASPWILEIGTKAWEPGGEGLASWDFLFLQPLFPSPWPSALPSGTSIWGEMG